MEQLIRELQLQLDSTTNILEKPGIRESITTAKEQLNSINARRNAEITRRAAIYIGEYWNAASLDLAFGRVYTYQSDSAGSLNKLRLNRNTGWGIWLNGGLPLGKRLLLSGLLRTTWYEEELQFTMRDNATLEESFGTAVAENKIYSLGLNLRYGSPIYSFFAEILTEKKAIKTAGEALAKSFTAPSQIEILQPSVQWTTVHPNSISVGGDWRISQNVIINYGMRWLMDKNWKTQAFIPVAGISCMMR